VHLDESFTITLEFDCAVIYSEVFSLKGTKLSKLKFPCFFHDNRGLGATFTFSHLADTFIESDLHLRSQD